MKQKLWVLLFAVALTLLVCKGSPAVSAADSGDPSIPKPTREQLLDTWAAIPDSNSTFAQNPCILPPYASGSLTQSFVSTGVSYLNFIRICANLPLIESDPQYNADAQHGAVLLASLNQLTHNPLQPPFMSDSFFQRAQSAISSSNLVYRQGFYCQSTLRAAVQDCMDDNGPHNLAAMGHRRWLLNPTLKRVGFGYAESLLGAEYTLLRIRDYSGDAVDYNFIAWPASGVFPAQVFGAEVPWTVTLNPERYAVPDANKITVTLTRLSDGKVWTFDQSTGGPVNDSLPYFCVNRDGYGVSNCIIFHPGSSNISSSYSGDWKVRITGLEDQRGKSASLEYTVAFFDLLRDAHKWSDWVAITEPTCTKAGLNWRACGVCGEMQTAPSAASGHSYICVEREYPTILLSGREALVCKQCGTITERLLPALGNPFCDVQEGRFYYDSVLWAADNAITTGTAESTFSPNEACTRAQVVTFLWRANGSPAPKGRANPFADVPAGKYYTEAVLWAVENGITEGVDATHFKPDDTVSRTQFVTFLYRAAEQPETSGENPFRDVPAGKYYSNAVMWAAETGITTGKTEDTFAADDDCTRAHVVTFLYREYAEK